MKNQHLLETLSNCIHHCNHCADACLDEENLKMMVPCIRTDRACAAVCESLAKVLSTSYSNIQGLVDYCAEICEACATECAKHDTDHCQACADACRKCAEACRGYAA